MNRSHSNNQKENTSLNICRKSIILGVKEPLYLDSGKILEKYTMAYETYGTLNPNRSNAILVCHPLTADHHIASQHPVTQKKGWWQRLVGPGKILDTTQFYIICANVLGGCMGTTGPKEINPKTGKRWGATFPVITIRDMVCVQKQLMDFLGIKKIFAVIGGSMGGMQVLQWAASYPEYVLSAIPLATTAKHSPQNIAFHEVGRRAIMSDADYCNGDYLEYNKKPYRGLAVARMMAHITYLSEESLYRKFGRRLQDKDQIAYSFEVDFQVESYLRHQGSTFVDRFDANSYLYLTRAMDYFDLAADYDNVLAKAFQATKIRFCLFSFSSDWLYPSHESRAIVRALNAVAADVSYAEIQSDKGHDGFLLEEPEFEKLLKSFIQSTKKYGNLDHR